MKELLALFCLGLALAPVAWVEKKRLQRGLRERAAEGRRRAKFIKRLAGVK